MSYLVAPRSPVLHPRSPRLDAPISIASPTRGIPQGKQACVTRGWSHIAIPPVQFTVPHSPKHFVEQKLVASTRGRTPYCSGSEHVKSQRESMRSTSLRRTLLARTATPLADRRVQQLSTPNNTRRSSIFCAPASSLASPRNVDAHGSATVAPCPDRWEGNSEKPIAKAKELAWSMRCGREVRRSVSPSHPGVRASPCVERIWSPKGKKFLKADSLINDCPHTRREKMLGQQFPDAKPWLEAAKSFQLNADFVLPNEFLEHGSLDLKSIMDLMKAESRGKLTIQALADKIILTQLLENLGLPCLPNLMVIRDAASMEDIAALIDREIMDNSDPDDIVMKPTHLSSGAGVINITTLKPHERDDVVDWIWHHVHEFMALQAAPHESLALQSLRPGFVVQPRYKSRVHFKLPLELRVVALWGKVRMGIWWWGRSESMDDHPQRNVWIVRQLAEKDKLGDEDSWKVLHNHTGSNPGFEKAIKIFEQHMSTMVKYCETLASAVGAPFLRADFFVGSARWGVRLNEVAYGCGCDYRSLDENGNVFDDAPAMAHILQEGMSLCHGCLPNYEFLSKLGMRGSSYEEASVNVLHNPHPLLNQIDTKHDDSVVSETHCETPPAPMAPLMAECLGVSRHPPKVVQTRSPHRHKQYQQRALVAQAIGASKERKSREPSCTVRRASLGG